MPRQTYQHDKDVSMYISPSCIGRVFTPAKLAGPKVFKAYRQCEQQSNYVIDFAKLLPYDWDTLYYFSGKWELDDIIDTLGIPLNAISYSDVGPKVFFMRQGHVVYQTGWFPYPPERCPKHIYFDTPEEDFVVEKSDAKFNVTKNDDAYGLKPLF